MAEKENRDDIKMLVNAIENSIVAMVNTVAFMAQGGRRPPVFQLTDVEREILSSLDVKQLALIIGIFARIGENSVDAALKEARANVK